MKLRQKKKNNTRRIYEDDNWVIDILSGEDYNPCIRISRFKDNHFVDDIEISGLLMGSDDLDRIKTSYINRDKICVSKGRGINERY